MVHTQSSAELRARLAAVLPLAGLTLASVAPWRIAHIWRAAVDVAQRRSAWKNTTPESSK